MEIWLFDGLGFDDSCCSDCMVVYKTEALELMGRFLFYKSKTNVGTF